MVLEQSRLRRLRVKGTANSEHESTWVFPKIGVPQNGWFIMDNPSKMDDLGVPLFLETSTSVLMSLDSFCTFATLESGLNILDLSNNLIII